MAAPMKLHELAPETLFPDPDNPALAPFTQEFIRVLFAHVKFERRAARLADVITRREGFGEKRPAAWSARARPKEFKNLCARYQRKHPDGLPEARAIVQCFKEAIRPCDQRNWLTHGVWWRIDPDAGLIHVHAVLARRKQPKSCQFALAKIQQLAESFKNLEAALWQLQNKIERRRNDEQSAATSARR
jgi:hypothetical protein